MTKLEMLNQMFLGTQFQKHISDFMRLSKSNIQNVYEYYEKNKSDKKTVAFCSTLLS